MKTGSGTWKVFLKYLRSILTTVFFTSSSEASSIALAPEPVNHAPRTWGLCFSDEKYIIASPQS